MYKAPYVQVCTNKQLHAVQLDSSAAPRKHADAAACSLLSHGGRLPPSPLPLQSFSSLIYIS